MFRRHLRMHITVATTFVALTFLALSANAQLLGKGGLLSGKGGACQKDKCEECVCTPYFLNICRGQHDCCGCGCAHSGCCNWCGHGKNWGWTLRSGALFPKCWKANAWKRYHHGYGYCGNGGCGGCGHGHGHCGCCGDGCGYCGGAGNDLFYNYYGPQTGAGGGVPTDMYASPHDTPHPAPQTYYTYQPWLPHEHMYHHNRMYTQYHSGGLGRSQTRVSYGASPIVRHFD